MVYIQMHEFVKNLDKREPRWQGVTARGPITEVKQLWAQLVPSETRWWLLRCDWHLLCSAMAYVIWAYKRFPECFPTCKKARVCAVMPMWLVHIKECVVSWNMPNHHTSMCHGWVCEWMLHWKTEWKGGLPGMRLQTCMFPSGMTQYEKETWAAK